MRALGCMVVRDECDIIELAVRHNLALLDGIAIIDHGSTDGTSEILAALAAEGLPVFVTPDRNPKFRQKAMINPLVRHAVMTADIDWIFVIDADEFIAAPSRADLEATLHGLPADRPSTLAWPTRIPSSFDPNVRLPERLARTRRVVNPGHRHTKMALPRQVLLRPGVEIGAGQHELEATRPDVVLAPGHPVPGAEISIAHVPIRSADQYVRKCAAGWLSVVAQERRRPYHTVQWRDAFDAYVAGEPVDDATLTTAAINYGIPRESWGDHVGHLEDAPPFLLAHEERYGRFARTLGLPALLKLAERLLTAPR